MRFSKQNWERFFTKGKKTTIRLKKKGTGIQKAYAGSRFKPQLLGTIKVGLPHRCLASDLTEEDAKNDGFDSLCELLLELGKLNEDIEVDSEIFIYPVVVKEGVK
jgi:hypothetical protein